jgi:hypothetical protein
MTAPSSSRHVRESLGNCQECNGYDGAYAFRLRRPNRPKGHEVRKSTSNSGQMGRISQKQAEK